MKIRLSIALLTIALAMGCDRFTPHVSPMLASGYPRFYEHLVTNDSHRSNDYSVIVFHSPTTATYFRRCTSTGVGGDTWFYFDDKARWGHFPKDQWPPQARNAQDFIWIKTTNVRFDYMVEGESLVEWDKMGKQGTWVRVENDSHR